MSTWWDDYLRQIKITLRTPAPGYSPEVKGNTCYFKPEWLDWTVTNSSIYVTARGPATRVAHRQGEKSWSVEGRSWGDERPDWLPLPVDALTNARFGIESVERALRANRENGGEPR